jgi:ribonuclease HI
MDLENEDMSRKRRKWEKKGKGETRVFFGKSGTRTAAQTALALNAAQELLASLPASSIVCYTDGACSGNPGPCGAGAVVVFPQGLDGKSERREDCVSFVRGTNNIGELWAIGMSLQMIKEEEHKNAPNFQQADVHILTDSKYSHGMLCKNWKMNKNIELVTAIRNQLDSFHRPPYSGRRVHIHWVAGHAGISGNERADELATRGVQGKGRVKIGREELEQKLQNADFLKGDSFLPSRSSVSISSGTDLAKQPSNQSFTAVSYSSRDDRQGSNLSDGTHNKRASSSHVSRSSACNNGMGSRNFGSSSFINLADTVVSEKTEHPTSSSCAAAEWTCNICTFVNQSLRLACDVCGSEKGVISADSDS